MSARSSHSFSLDIPASVVALIQAPVLSFSVTSSASISSSSSGRGVRGGGGDELEGVAASSFGGKEEADRPRVMDESLLLEGIRGLTIKAQTDRKLAAVRAATAAHRDTLNFKDSDDLQSTAEDPGDDDQRAGGEEDEKKPTRSLKTETISKNTIQQIDFADVAELVLSYKNIHKTENLETFTNLIVLRLDNNHIRVLPDLRGLVHLEKVDVSFNKLESIFGVCRLPRLFELAAYHNNVASLECLVCERSAVAAGTSRLSVLSVGHNQLTDLQATSSCLGRLPLLRSLAIAENPLCQDTCYPSALLSALPGLQYFDFVLRCKVQAATVASPAAAPVAVPSVTRGSQHHSGKIKNSRAAADGAAVESFRKSTASGLRGSREDTHPSPDPSRTKQAHAIGAGGLPDANLPSNADTQQQVSDDLVADENSLHGAQGLQLDVIPTLGQGSPLLDAIQDLPAVLLPPPEEAETEQLVEVILTLQKLDDYQELQENFTLTIQEICRHTQHAAEESLREREEAVSSFIVATETLSSRRRSVVMKELKKLRKKQKALRAEIEGGARLGPEQNKKGHTLTITLIDNQKLPTTHKNNGRYSILASSYRAITFGAK
eukprot:GHVT01087787.1.p1 GENE.GHVT01087787.1~~GHVT01087787.1.p1  ORF type:complete len:605 (+),score=110.07 GHVT01087787.1:161-1975(+)